MSRRGCRPTARCRHRGAAPYAESRDLHAAITVMDEARVGLSHALADGLLERTQREVTPQGGWRRARRRSGGPARALFEFSNDRPPDGVLAANPE